MEPNDDGLNAARGFFRAALIGLGFWLLILAIVLLSGCATIEHKPAERIGLAVGAVLVAGYAAQHSHSEPAALTADQRIPRTPQGSALQ